MLETNIKINSKQLASYLLLKNTVFQFISYYFLEYFQMETSSDSADQMEKQPFLFKMSRCK